MKLRESNVFTGVCHSVHWGGVYAWFQVPSWRGGYVWSLVPSGGIPRGIPGRGWVYQGMAILGVIPEVGSIPGEGWVRIPGAGYDLVYPNLLVLTSSDDH